MKLFMLSGAICFLLCGCELFDGGRSAVEPPSYSEPVAPRESVLNDLGPIRPRDMLLENEQVKQQPK